MKAPSIMDTVSEYAARYGGPPDRRRSWHEFAALAWRTARFAARELLAIRDGGLLAQAPSDGTAMMITAELRQQAAGV